MTKSPGALRAPGLFRVQIATIAAFGPPVAKATPISVFFESGAEFHAHYIRRYVQLLQFASEP